MENYKIKKSALISAILNNKKMFDDISDAFNSSPGSSKRERISSVLKAFNSGVDNGMGKGGATDPAFNISEPLSALGETMAPAPDQSSAVIFNAAPIKPKTQTGPVPGGDLTGEGMVTLAEAPSSEIRGTGIVDMGEGEIGAIKPTVSTEDTTKPDLSTLSAYGNEYVDEWWQSLNTDQKEQFKPIYDAVSQGIGSRAFTEKMMSDKETLKKLTGLPDEALPEGASLARNINSLEDTLRSKHNIEGIEGNLEKLASRGLNIEQNLQDYITGRDQYIEKLDGLIDSTKDSMAGMDLSDGKVRKPMDSYVNYLYILKGRQQKRYVDFMKMGIDYHNNELKQAQMTYDSAYKKFDNEFSRMATVTQEDYNKMHEMLGDMYNNLDTRADIILNRAKKQMDILEVENQIASDTAARDLGFESTKEYDKAFNNWQLLQVKNGVPLADIKREEFDALSPDSKKFFKDQTSDTILYAAQEEASAEAISKYVSGIMSGDPEYYNDFGKINYEAMPEQQVEAIKKEVEDMEKLIDTLAKKIADGDEEFVDEDGKLQGMALSIPPGWYERLKKKIKEHAKKYAGETFRTGYSVFTPDEIDWEGAELSYGLAD